MRWFIANMLVAGVLGLGAVAAAQEQVPAALEVTEVTPQVFVLSGMSVNMCLVIGDRTAVLVDSGYDPLVPQLESAIKEKTDKPLGVVINTHWHRDHVGANEALAKAGAQIMAHENVRKRMSSEQMLGGFGRKMPPWPAAAVPTITFSTEIGLDEGVEKLRVVHLEPGHTDGDSVVWFERANALMTGDLYFNGMYPYIDVNAGGSIDRIVARLDELLKQVRPDTKIIPGHGPIATPEELRAYRQTLNEISGRVQAMIKAGKSRDEVIAAKPTQDLDEKWNRGPIKTEVFVGIVYDGLVKG